jgi:hypothetical protein
METIYIVVDMAAAGHALGLVVDQSEIFATAKAIAEEHSRKNPGKRYLVFQCVGSCVQETVWKPVEQKPVTLTEGQIYREDGSLGATEERGDGMKQLDRLSLKDPPHVMPIYGAKIKR